MDDQINNGVSNSQNDVPPTQNDVPLAGNNVPDLPNVVATPADNVGGTQNTVVAASENASGSGDVESTSNVKLSIDKNVCLQCGTCAINYPDWFRITDDGSVDDSNANVPSDKADEVADICPVGAIGK